MNSSTQVSIESKMNLIITATNKIPKTLLFKIGNDLDKINEYLNFVYEQNPELKSIDEDSVIRMVIAKHLRIINMKLSDPTVLLIVALNNLSRSDLSLSEKILVSKLVNQNREKFDLDIIGKVVAQVRTKLPKDLSARLTPNHIINLKNLLVSNMESIDNLTERYQDMSNLNLEDIDTPEELSMFHMELERYRDQDTSYEAQELRDKKLKELKEKENELIRATDLEHVNRDNSVVINASYVEREPVLMEDPELKKMYHYDEYSKTLKRLPKDDEMYVVSPEHIESILQEHDISNDELLETLEYLKNNKIFDKEAQNYVFTANKDYTDKISEKENSGDIPSKNTIMKKILIGLSVVVLVVLIVSIIIFKRKKKLVK